MTRRLAFALVAFLGLASCAFAQVCDECVDAPPYCPQNQQPTCQGGTWVCPEPLCGDVERSICEEDYCGYFDEESCICHSSPEGCSQCDPWERDACIWEYCPDDGWCWDDEWCWCWGWNFNGKDRPRMSRKDQRQTFLGTFPTRTTSCEARHTPTYVEIWYMSGIRHHTGENVRDFHGAIVGSGWGISQVIRWTVFDEEDNQMREGGMRASEYLDTLAANPYPQLNLNRSVGVDDDGVFYDVYALLTNWPGLRVGNYSIARQRIEVSQRHDGNTTRHPVLSHCVRITHDSISADPCWRWGF